MSGKRWPTLQINPGFMDVLQHGFAGILQCAEARDGVGCHHFPAGGPGLFGHEPHGDQSWSPAAKNYRIS